MASAFPGGIDSLPDITNPTVTDCNVAPTLSTRLNLALDAVTAIETYILANIANWVPPSGIVSEFAGSTAPTGWLLCDGSLVSRTTFANLFAVCGTSYGVGDGSTTFGLPDLRGRSPMGAGTGTGLTARVRGQQLGEQTHLLVTAELAAHTHGITDPGHTHGYTDPGHTHTYVNPVNSTGSTLAGGSGFGVGAQNTGVSGIGITIAAAGTGINGTLSNGSGIGHNTIHPVTVLNFIIKT